MKKKDNISTYYNQIYILKILFQHNIFSRAFTVRKWILIISRLTDQTICSLVFQRRFFLGVGGFHIWLHYKKKCWPCRWTPLLFSQEYYTWSLLMMFAVSSGANNFIITNMLFLSLSLIVWWQQDNKKARKPVRQGAPEKVQDGKEI